MQSTFTYIFHLRSCNNNTKTIESSAETMFVNDLCVAIREKVNIFFDNLEIWKDGNKMDNYDKVYPGTDMELRRIPATPKWNMLKNKFPKKSDEEIREIRKKVLYGFTPAPKTNEGVEASKASEASEASDLPAREDHCEEEDEEEEDEEKPRKCRRIFSWGRKAQRIGL